ncbi:hypothetical protein KVV02_003490 [Mortierella alpina]|uniref:Arm-like repeat domain-containing protein n=1 Tax=Mortierella alpina TaxID=64518 RepID=A0A9P8A7S6_MORAP|nr:hypothetical protein KVV02_003490 [Mortierella alpina]
MGSVHGNNFLSQFIERGLHFHRPKENLKVAVLSLRHGWRSSLSPQQVLNAAKLQLLAASNAEDDAVALVFCEKAKMDLDRLKRPKSSSTTESADFRAFREEVSSAYSEHADFLANRECFDKVLDSRSKSEKWRPAPVQIVQIAVRECAPFPKDIFDTDDARPTTIPNEMPEAVLTINVDSFVGWFGIIRTGLEEIHDVPVAIKDAYARAQSLCSSGRELKTALKDVNFDRKCTWYIALRAASTLLGTGRLTEVKKLVCEAPCRRALAFQWGVCLRLGDLAIDLQWNDKPRRDAVAFLGHLYRDDDYWGQHLLVKQLILDILMQLRMSPPSVAQGRFTRTEEISFWLSVRGANILFPNSQNHDLSSSRG